MALVMTPDGFPLDYEVLDSNTSEHKTLRPLLDYMEKTYGQARRECLMDRGIPKLLCAICGNPEGGRFTW